MPAGFTKAHASFREHIAQTLGVGVDDVQLGPAYEEAGNQFEHTVGRAWGFRGFRKDDPPQSVQGWATADGTVVTREQNLGVLFEQAGVWTDAPKLTAAELAERLVWSMGMEYRVFVEPSSGAPVPALQVGEDGAGTLVFFVSYKQAGPGGAGGGPEQHYKATVTLTPDHKATLEMTEFAL